MKRLPEMLGKLAFFGAILAGLIICCTPELTWINQELDLFDWTFCTSVDNVVAHPPGAPLYISWGRLIHLLPGNDVWNLTFFLSVIPTFCTSILIFRMVSLKTTRKLIPYVATAAFAGSQIAFSQAVVPEIYALETFLIVFAYCLFETKWFRLGAVVGGTSLCLSWGAWILIPFFIARYVWKNPNRVQLILLGAVPLLLSYPYVILDNYSPHLSMGPTSLSNLWVYFSQHGGTLLNLAIWRVPERLLDFSLIMVGSMGLALVLLILLAKIVWRNKDTRFALFCAMPGLIFYATTKGPDGFVQLCVSIAFLSIALGYALSDVNAKPVVLRLAPMAMIISVILFGLNIWYYDAGRTIDRTFTAREFYNSLDQVNNGDLVICWDAATYAGVYQYNEENDKSIIGMYPVFMDPEHAYEWYIPTNPEGKDPIVYNWDQGIIPEVPETPIRDGEDYISNRDRWNTHWSLVFADYNPSYNIWTMKQGSDRTIKDAEIFCIQGPDVITETIAYTTTVPSDTTIVDYITVYPYSYHYVSGYYFEHPKWVRSEKTNFTVWFITVFLITGGLTGWFIERKLKNRVKPKVRTLVAMIASLCVSFLVGLLMSLGGMEGFRL